jgi:NADH dehydrogenase [ubiquinone] 1 alpha subcomplex assembly factor 7
MSYDPDLRRDTPLALKLNARIRESGPISVAQYMQACLHDEEFGYYRTQGAIGADGDFITAPEISQVFGELIGLWCVVVWRQMGSPKRVHLVEIGPGRGTFMRDVMRAASGSADFMAAVSVQLIEPNRVLREIQAATLASTPVPVTYLGPNDYPKYPTIFIANEVLDCIPVDQIEFAVGPDGATGWFIRTVDLDASGALHFGIGRKIEPPAQWIVPAPTIGDILEGGRTKLMFEGMGHAYAGVPMAGLFVDYGYEATRTGDTLQAARNHAYEHALTSPGEADLTAHVNFAQARDAVLRAGLAVDGPVTQAEFLGSLGILQRASKLMAANPAKASEIEMGVARLMAPNGMGTRFKAIGLRSRGLPLLPGFPTL